MLNPDLNKSIIGETPVNFEDSNMYKISEIAATMCGDYCGYECDAGGVVSDCAKDLVENGRYTPV